MPETPDFKQLAQRHAIERLSVDEEAAVELEQAFRDVWNARGVADGQAVESRIRELVAGEIVGAGIARHVAAAIHKVDR